MSVNVTASDIVRSKWLQGGIQNALKRLILFLITFFVTILEVTSLQLK